MRPKDIALSKVLAPGKAVTGRPAASVSMGCAMPSSGGTPVPISPFSDWKKTCMPAGRYLATRLGIPKPRLTSMPRNSSLAIRPALRVCGSMLCSQVGDKIIDEGSRRHDLIGREHADRNDVLLAGENGSGGHRDHRIEIARRELIAQIA